MWDFLRCAIFPLYSIHASWTSAVNQSSVLLHQCCCSTPMMLVAPGPWWERAVTQAPRGLGSVRAAVVSWENQLSTTLEIMNSGPGSLWLYHVMLQPGNYGNRHVIWDAKLYYWGGGSLGGLGGGGVICFNIFLDWKYLRILKTPIKMASPA